MKKIIPILFICLLLISGCAEQNLSLSECDFNKDGTVDKIEERRCGQQQLPGKCGDGICDNIEKQRGTCPEDCESEVAMIDCGNSLLLQETTHGDMDNFDCFIEASKDCNPAKLLWTMTIDFFGTVMTSTTYMELKGSEENKCTYYQRTESVSVDLNDETVQQMLDSGLTQEEIDKQKQTANEGAQLTIGTETTCKFLTADLAAMLNNQKVLNAGTGEYICEECSWKKDCKEGFYCSRSECVPE